MKHQTLKLLKALLENSKRSDRELAKVIGVSQPTVTRNRKLLAQYIRSYTIVPEFSKIGYEILALTFAKSRTHSKKTIEAKVPMMKEWFMNRGNVIFVSDGEGLGKDIVIVSVHKDYSGYATFMRNSAMNFADIASDFQSFVVSLKTGTMMKPFDLTYLADDVEELAKQP
jgi:DNA-binding Lrp family transcriptional regulator